MVEDNKAVNTVSSEETDANITEKAAPEDVSENDGSSVEKPEKKSFWNENKVEIIVAILLGVTALLTAWASWIGSLHGGIQAINFTKSNNTSSQATSAYNLGLQMFLSDIMTWNTMMDYSFEMAMAEADGNPLISPEDRQWYRMKLLEALQACGDDDQNAQ